MTAGVLTFFNNKGGVGKTTLVYNLSHMYAELGHRVVVVDLDPQANLTAAFLDEDRLEQLWGSTPGASTIYRSVKPLTVFILRTSESGANAEVLAKGVEEAAG